MKAIIYEISEYQKDWGMSGVHYSCIALDVDSEQEAVGVASERSMEGKSFEYLVVCEGFESSPRPEFFDKDTRLSCELNFEDQTNDGNEYERC